MNLNKLLILVVLYEPSESMVSKILLYKDTYDVLILDNSKIGVYDFFKPYDRLKYFHFGENIGLSRAYNFAMNYCHDIESHGLYDYLMILDQDSELDLSILNEASNVLDYNNINLNSIGIIGLTPIYKGSKSKVKNKNAFLYDDILISSGSILNIKALGGKLRFDERFFIDDVDTEFCFKVLLSGLHTIRLTGIYFDHVIGEPIKIKISGESKYIFNHSPLRYYYLVRNTLLLNKLFSKCGDASIKKYIGLQKSHWLRDIVSEIMLSSDRLIKYYYMMLGLFHYLEECYGKLSDVFLVNSFSDIVVVLRKQNIFVLFILSRMQLFDLILSRNIRRLNSSYENKNHKKLLKQYLLKMLF